MKFTKEQARRIAMNCAKIYDRKLAGKEFLIIYRDKQENKICYIVVVFYKENYQHLTGLEVVDKNGKVLHNHSGNFYRKCIENKLGLNDFQFKKDGTTPLKLQALPVLTDICKITKITGDYNHIKPYLVVDKLIGNVNFCLGLSKENNKYVPSSALLENIKKLTDAPSQVLAIFEKTPEDKIYKTIKHVAKGLNIANIILPADIQSMISLENVLQRSKK